MSTDGHTPNSTGGGAGEPRTGMRLWLKVLLAVSLAANLAVAGLAIAAFMRWHAMKPEPPMRRSFGNARIIGKGE